MTTQDTASQPRRPHVNRGQRFWQVQVPLVVLQACAGNAILLAAWVATAASLEEDKALRDRPRSPHELNDAVAAQLGLTGQEEIITSLLVELERLQLLMVIDDEAIIPVFTLAEASEREGDRILSKADEREAARFASSHRQDALPGFAD